LARAVREVSADRRPSLADRTAFVARHSRPALSARLAAIIEETAIANETGKPVAAPLPGAIGTPTKPEGRREIAE
jgi:hypothetical protein